MCFIHYNSIEPGFEGYEEKDIEEKPELLQSIVRRKRLFPSDASRCISSVASELYIFGCWRGVLPTPIFLSPSLCIIQFN